MKYRYIQIFSFLVALLSFSIFSACEVDDKIVFVQDKVNPPSQSEEMSFSVSESKQVCFSKGNLQYHPANNEWRFAESQLDYIGDANINISATYNGWLDLFGWSTSATNFGVSTSTNDNDYSGDFVDWGTNQIGSDAPNTWRTLSNDEWDYLLNTRTNADALRGVAQVNGVNGLVFLPDSWTCPEGVTFKSGFSKWSVAAYGQYQTFTAEQWSLLESAGAIFLPAAGDRYGSDVGYVQNHGNYWSATENNSFRAYYLYFVSDEAFMYGSNRYDGSSVRLVKDLLPVVTTSTITQITETTAVAGGSVTSDGNASVTERGVVYSTNPNPVITNLYNTIKPCGSGTGSFTCDLTNLQSNTTYYVRAYATNEMGTAYGEEISFTTVSLNGHEYVDLGLSVKWATCNVGASSPEKYGDFFAWGETEPKEQYYWSTYKHYNDSLTKYNIFGTVADNKTQLELSDDAARANWGGSWRMPIYAELTELREQCTWTWTTQNGVKGYKVTSKSNGNSIFLPAAGSRDGTSLGYPGSFGNYWLSSLDTLYTDNSNKAYYLYFNSGFVGCGSKSRYLGFSVRPVCP